MNASASLHFSSADHDKLPATGVWLAFTIAFTRGRHTLIDAVVPEGPAATG
ncbi:hypothetical protein [Kosakonia quasisacchari]|uniref:hypothetical protein n=1 Tax=Kosakonia quasisacchari TaxID=2529380 RepID=UPI0013F15B75|nr:hypothetical protein [Kosakonia quasisacchari]